jgi:hypothetical protein
MSPAEHVATRLEVVKVPAAGAEPVAESVRAQQAADDHELSGDAAMVAALAAGESVAGAARLAGVSDRTVRRRLADPLFVAAVDLARAELLDESLGLLSASASVAVRVLRLIAADKQYGAAARVTAAGRLLDAVLRHRQALDLERRLAALERAAELQS